MQKVESLKKSWFDHKFSDAKTIKWELIVFIVILLLAFGSRFYDLGARVMSHDENTHVFYSWRFYKGQGLAHDPLMHGPFHLHLVALSYFLFGDSDFTARIPSALFSVATIGFMWFYRRYLGKTGGFIAAVLFLISPYFLYYGRYVRNEAFVGLFGVVTIWSILRYLDSGKSRYAYYLMAATALHFTAKETSFIYTAQAMTFLFTYFIYQVTKSEWRNIGHRKIFILGLIGTLIFLIIFGMTFVLEKSTGLVSPTETVAPSIPGEQHELTPTSGLTEFQIVLLGASIFFLLFTTYILLSGYGWERVRSNRAMSLLILLGTMVLPHLSAFPIRMLNWTLPTNASQVMALTFEDILKIGLVVVPLALISIGVGILWNRKEWLINAGIFYGLFTIFFTSVFTNGAGFFTGLVGSLGYWLEQQGVQRGSQPVYYYALVQIPIYEYLPALGTLLAFVLGLFGFKKSSLPEDTPEQEMLPEPFGGKKIDVHQAPVFPLLGFWAVTSLLAYSIAGEKMPWLTVHIALPMILCAAWAFDRLVSWTDWSVFRKQRAWLFLVVLIVFVLSFSSTIGSLLGSHPPFQGKTLEQLQDTSTFLTSILVTLLSGVVLWRVIQGWKVGQFVLLGGNFILLCLAVLTARTAYQAAYINYDNANELLVYAHSAGGVKRALSQIEELSLRITDGYTLEVAYDNATSYPYWWYLRNYPNQRYYGADPTRSLRDVPVILVGDENYGKIEPIVGNAYQRFDYIRLWWPNQDYFNLNWERIVNAWTDRNMREALFEIWLNRDYTKYGEVTNRDMRLENWSPAARMRLYIRKDIIGKIWNYGVAPVVEEIEPDPFEDKQVELSADLIIGSQGSEPGQFIHPRDIAIANDGSLYVVDTDNHRIQHIAPDGSVLHVWGSFGDITAGSAPGGTFNQPWGIGIGLDGSLYVADTWNHRVQKFTPEGEFVTMWGYFGQGETPEAFWGPRDVAVDSQGRVFVTDTGNKRVVVFDENGNVITQFGSPGFGPGELDEPVGIAIDQNDRIYVADTWNRRIQIFEEKDAAFLPVATWDLVAWFGQSLDNKPFLTVSIDGNVFAADPEGYRILQFDSQGKAVRFWGEFGTGDQQFGMPASVAADFEGGVWVVDSGNGRIMHFTLPESTGGK